MAVRPVLDKDGKQRIDPERKKPVWQIDYYPTGAKGRRKRFRFKGKEGAAQYLYLRLRAGKHHRIPVDAKVADLLPLWLKYYKKNSSVSSTYNDVILTLRVLVPFFGDLQVDALDQDIIEEYKAKRLNDDNRNRPDQKVTKRTITKELSYFSSLLKWAFESGKIKIHFRFKNFKKQDAPAKVFLSPEELHKFQLATVKKHKLSVMLMSDGGLRIHEALALRASHIDLANDLINVRGKGSKQRIVPIMTDRLRKKLTERVNQVRIQCRKNPQLEDYLSINP